MIYTDHKMQVNKLIPHTHPGLTGYTEGRDVDHGDRVPLDKRRYHTHTGGSEKVYLPAYIGNWEDHSASGHIVTLGSIARRVRHGGTGAQTTPKFGELAQVISPATSTWLSTVLMYGLMRGGPTTGIVNIRDASDGTPGFSILSSEGFDMTNAPYPCSLEDSDYKVLLITVELPTPVYLKYGFQYAICCAGDCNLWEVIREWGYQCSTTNESYRNVGYRWKLIDGVWTYQPTRYLLYKAG